MGIELIAIDLDGTLLTSSKEVSAATSAILRQARREAGVAIVLATARAPRSVLGFHSLLELDTPIIAYNGALVYQPSEARAVLHKPISAELALSLGAFARGVYPEVRVSAEVLDVWYTDHHDPSYAVASTENSEPRIEPLEAFLNRPVTKLLLLGEPERVSGLREAVDSAYRHQVAMVQTEGFLLQVMNATASKAQALRAVAREMHVPRERVMAIGDNANDVGMLQWAGIGVAMGNASPEAKAAADYITADNDGDGVARAIHHLILTGRL